MNTAKLLSLSLLMLCGSAFAADMAKISGGSYRPLYLKKDTPMIAVAAFELDKTPVTNREFAQFVQKHPQWQRGKISSKQADGHYLQQWVKRGQGFAPKAGDADKPGDNSHANTGHPGKPARSTEAVLEEGAPSMQEGKDHRRIGSISVHGADNAPNDVTFDI